MTEEDAKQQKQKLDQSLKKNKWRIANENVECLLFCVCVMLNIFALIFENAIIDKELNKKEAGSSAVE